MDAHYHPTYLVGRSDTNAQAGILNCGGQQVHWASAPRIYYQGKQNDRGAVMQMPHIPPEEVYPWLDSMFKAAQNKLAAQWRWSKGATTMTTAYYDPTNFTLAVSHAGDSPAYLMLSDGDKSAWIQLTSPFHVFRDNLLSWVSGVKSEQKDCFRCEHASVFSHMDAEITQNKSAALSELQQRIDAIFTLFEQPYSIVNKTVEELESEHWEVIDEANQYLWKTEENPDYRTPLDLQKTIEKSADYYDMNIEQVEASIVIATDGINEQKNHELAALAFDASAAPNLASRFCKLSEKKNDNIALAVIPDIKQGKGKPCFICMNDGIGKNSAQTAEAAMDAALDIALQKQEYIDPVRSARRGCWTRLLGEKRNDPSPHFP
ncbi:MAG: hypothetical protein SFX19_04535 [Alphaproteobacteria bacterium]|nr:hypothetical protein [Alphaproteobacteria bacterium]